MNPNQVDPAVMQVGFGVQGGFGRQNFGGQQQQNYQQQPQRQFAYDGWGASAQAQPNYTQDTRGGGNQRDRDANQSQGPTYTFDQWMGMLDNEVVEVIAGLIDDKLLKDSDLDSSCLEELHNRPVPEAHAALRLYREICNSNEIRNPSAYITKLLKNPGNRGGRGGRGGRGRGDGRGRGRGRGNFNPEWADHAEKSLQEALGPRFQELDDKALAFAKKTKPELINHLVEEYTQQAATVRNVSAWVTKILFANSQSGREGGAAQPGAQ